MRDYVFEAGIVLLIAVALYFAADAFIETQRDIGYAEAVAEANAAKLRAVAEARARESEWRENYERARRDIEEKDRRIAELQAGGRAAAAAVGRLRGELADAAGRLSADASAACAASSAPLAAVFAECVGRVAELGKRHGELAEKADRHALDARQLSESWPK